MRQHSRFARLLCIGLMVTMLASCTRELQMNEGAVQMAHSADGNRVASLFLQPTAYDSTPVKKDEAISVKLIAAYICDFRENRRTGDWLSNGNKGAKPCKSGDGNLAWLGSAAHTLGEIAILANAGEHNSMTGLTFNSSDLQRNGRVIYYNEDMRESGQLINALNIPVYGPKSYDGGTFFMDLAVMELDNEENKQGRQLLQEMARIGSAAYAPGTPVINLLNTLGGALLSANGDDVELRYQMEFDAEVTATTVRSPLREGYYAIVRMEQRDKLPDFSKMTITADLHNPLLVNQDGTLFTGGSWLLMRVAREDPAQALSQDIATKLSAVLGNGSTTTESQVKDLDAILKAVESVRKPSTVP